jgi:hypothetical protein
VGAGAQAVLKDGQGVTACRDRHPHQKLLALAVHEIRRSINAAFLLYAMELRESVPYGFLPDDDRRWRTRGTLALFYPPVNFTVLCDTICESLSCGHLDVWFVHVGSRFLRASWCAAVLIEASGFGEIFHFFCRMAAATLEAMCSGMPTTSTTKVRNSGESSGKLLAISISA